MMRSRRVWLLAVMLVWSVGAGAEERLRITPLVRGKQVLVSFELQDAYTPAVRDGIVSGLQTTFTYSLELRMRAPIWIDRTIATTVVTASDHYDNLTRRHTLTRTVEGHADTVSVTEDEAAVK